MSEAARRVVGSIALDIVGIGIVFFAPPAVAGIREGEDFLEDRYTSPADVAAHVNACAISGFCTGSPGRYSLNVFQGVPTPEAMERSQFKARLGLEVGDGCVHFRDLYDLMNWHAASPNEQVVRMPDGFYSVTALSSLPASGVAGDGQSIDLYFKSVSEKPALRWEGVPLLCE
jgi:hypothetical protein